MTKPKAKVDGATTKSDMVNHPPHYTAGGIECIDALEAMMSEEEFKGFLKGTIVRYIWRGPLKENEQQDYEKACWYLKRLNEKMSRKKGKGESNG